MEQSVKVWFYLKKNEANEEGRCPVMARLTVGNTASVFSMKLTAPVSLWTSGRAQGKSAEAGRINGNWMRYVLPSCPSIGNGQLFATT